jgi:Kef-type K+ transport system membrane component KefB
MLVWILLVSLIVAAVATVLGIVFKYGRNKQYRKGLWISYAVCVVLLIFSVTLGSIYAGEVNTLQYEYDNIMLYNDVVADCENEAVRFGHYEKIHAFNDEYNRLTAASENYFFGDLFPHDWSANMSVIEFQFRGVDYDYTIGE